MATSAIESLPDEQRDRDLAREVDTPALVFDPEVVRARFADLQRALPLGTTIRYAVKCNPAPVALQTLHHEGSAFEISSVAELDLVRAQGVDPAEVVHSLPVRSRTDIRESRARGMGRWSVDSRQEIEKLAVEAPGAELSIRVLVDDSASHWPLSSKFGIRLDRASELADTALTLGFDVAGVSFHVGSQETDVGAWARAIQHVSPLIDRLAQEREQPVLNVGGGFPVDYGDGAPSIRSIGRSISDAVAALPVRVKVEAEPGRFLVAQAGTLVVEVTGVSERGGDRWVFVDAGAFNGLYEASPGGGGLRVPVEPLDAGGATTGPATLAGPSCDAGDVLGTLELPTDLDAGDRLLVRSAGAYSLAYVTDFCGAPKPEVVILGQESSRAEAVVDVEGVDLYRVAWPGTELFDRAARLEQQWFELSGFTDPDDPDGYDDYAAASTFVVVDDGDDSIVSICRLISNSTKGFKTLNDFELYDEASEQLERVHPNRVIEVGTMATHPAARGLGPTLDLIRGVIDVTRFRGIDHMICSIDAGLVEAFAGPPLYLPWFPIGEPKDYYGSLTVPCLARVSDHIRDLPDRSPEMFEFIYEGGTARPSL